MKKILLQILLLIVLVGLLAAAVSWERYVNRPGPHDATYILDGQSVTLKNGVSTVDAAPGSASKIVTRYFGNDVRHDFDGDGREDSAFIITQETGGSGIFYYVVARLDKVGARVGSVGMLLGDRIAPQNINMAGQSEPSADPNEIVVNYADRNLGESFAVSPSVGKSLWLLLDTKIMQFSEVVQNSH